MKTTTELTIYNNDTKWEVTDPSSYNVSNVDTLYSLPGEYKNGRFIPRVNGPHRLLKYHWGGSFAKVHSGELSFVSPLYKERVCSNGGGKGTDYVVVLTNDKAAPIKHIGSLPRRRRGNPEPSTLSMEEALNLF